MLNLPPLRALTISFLPHGVPKLVTSMDVFLSLSSPQPPISVIITIIIKPSLLSWPHSYVHIPGLFLDTSLAFRVVCDTNEWLSRVQKLATFYKWSCPRIIGFNQNTVKVYQTQGHRVSCVWVSAIAILNSSCYDSCDVERLISERRCKARDRGQLTDEPKDATGVDETSESERNERRTNEQDTDFW